MRNRFFVWPPGADAATEFEPQDYLLSGKLSDMFYFCRILQTLDHHMPDAAITFLVTWNLDAFDPRFEGTVVFLIGDERYQTPSFAERVRAVFKTGGTHRNPVGRTLELPWSIAWRVLLRDARNALVKFRRAGDFASARMQFDIPLGTYHLIDVPYVPIEARPIDVFFAGTAPELTGVNPRPSVAARLQLMKAIGEAERALPDWRFEHRLTRTDGALYDAAEYSTKTMSAKIIPCPRGNFDETFRLFEAARSGCVVISEPLPERWYYRDAPVVQLRSWSELVPTLRTFKADPKRLGHLAARTLSWWNDCLSETAIARYITGVLSQKPDRNPMSKA